MTTVAAPVYCEADFVYFDEAGARTVTMPVHDGRAETLTFEAAGFELVAHESAVADWRDESQINSTHATEIRTLAQAFSGCDVTIVYPTILRNTEAATRTADHAPINLVHSDFSSDFGRMIVETGRPYRAFLDPMLERQGVGLDDLRSARRVAMVQFWRNTGPVEADHPLAFCDARTMAADRLRPFVVSHYAGEHLEFETLAFSTPDEREPTDRWFTFPQMTTDEVVALRTYDSTCIAEGRPFWTPHSAFRDPHVPDGPGTRRESVEMRALCVWL